MKDFDLIIIGGGAAGFSAAMKADELQARTLLVNNNTVGIGGTCVNVGCLPTKHLLHLAEVIHRGKFNNLNGVKASMSSDFRTIMNEKDKLITRLRKEKYEKVLSKLSHVEFIEGTASFVNKSKIQVNGDTFCAPKFIIATGSSTRIPSIKGLSEAEYLTNIEALRLKKLPESMAILGGGPLGVEFAQLFSRLGTRVCLLQRKDRIVPREEPELSSLLQGYLEEEGIEIWTKVYILSISQDRNHKIIKTTINGEEKQFRVEKLMIASGRRPNTEGFDLEKLGIKQGNRGELKVNEEMKAGGNIWAAGDVTGEPMLETVAAREGMIAANNALSEKKMPMDYRVVPHAVFTDPQLASVGLTDELAVKMGRNCSCNTISMELVPKAQAILDTRGAIKIVIDNSTQEIMGIHILAPQAADLIHEGAMILKNRMTVDDVIDTLHIFPTLSEAIKLGAQSFRRDISNMSCCAE